MNPTQKEQKTETERLEALYSISTRLGSTLDLEELLNLVIDAVIQLTGAARGFVVLVDEWGRLKTMAARNVEQESIGGTEIPISRTIVQRVVATGEPVLTSNAQEDARFSDRRSIIGYQFRSIMSAPLRARGRVTGAVFVDNHMLAGVFNEQDLDLLVTFANQAAIAIDNARLFQQTDLALTKRVDELALFQEIDRELHTSGKLSRTIDLVLEWAMNLTKADATAVGILEQAESGESDDASMRMKTLIQQDGVKTFSKEDQQIPLSHSILCKMIDQRDMVQTQNASVEHSFLGQAVAVQLVMPIMRNEQLLGFLALERKDIPLFFDDDVEFVRRLSDRAAVAIGNFRLNEELRGEVEKRTKFISTMTHELRLPLTSIRGYADLLGKQLVGPLNEQQSSFMQTIQRNVLRMTRLISDLSDINRIESERMTFDRYEFDLKAAIKEAVGNLTPQVSEKQQTVKQDIPDKALLIYTDYAKIVQILDNILENAHQYTPESGLIKIALTDKSQEETPMFQIKIIDNGLGMRDDERVRVFEQFFRSDEQAVRDYAGWGLGLPVTEMLVNALGGSIQFESTHGKGTEVTLLLPVKVS